MACACMPTGRLVILQGDLRQQASEHKRSQFHGVPAGSTGTEHLNADLGIGCGDALVCKPSACQWLDADSILHLLARAHAVTSWVRSAG